MPLSHIEHYLVAADDIAGTGEWYCRALGLREGPHPDFGFPVIWLYIGERDVVHIGPLDHIAFRATGLKQTMARLKSLGIAFSERRASNQALYQLFLHDPNGIKIELNFDAAEAEGVRAEAMASEFARD